MRAAADLLVAVVVLAVGGCSDGEQGEVNSGLSAEAVAERYNYDIDAAEYTPVYEFAPAFNIDEEERVRHVFYANCLKDVVDYKIPDTNPDAELRGTDGQPLFDEEIAAQWGYPSLRMFPHESFGIPDDDLTPESQSEFDQCGAEFSEKIMMPSRLTLDGIENAGWDATKDNPDIQKAEEAWVECMAPEGIVDLPDSPWEMPPKSFKGMPDENGNISDQDIELTEKERALAVADAHCRDETGYNKAFFRARAEGELTAIGKDIESFEASRVDYEKYQEAMETVLAENS